MGTERTHYEKSCSMDRGCVFVSRLFDRKLGVVTQVYVQRLSVCVFSFLLILQTGTMI